jgi:NAD(P)-dependent dehydrogenase (short-subunit alcohol dehydrogenase family)
MSTSVATGIRAGLETQRTTSPRTADRVVISGFETAAGQAIARVFAQKNARLVLLAGSADDTVAMAAGHLAAKAKSVSLLNTSGPSRADAVADAQTAIGALGGADTVVVVLALSPEMLRGVARGADPEQALDGLLSGPVETIRIAANRMRVTWTAGTVVAVVVMPEGLAIREDLVARLVKSQVAGVVRGEAERLADDGIVVVAVSATETGLPTEGCVPELADLVADLAGMPKDRLSGLVYEAAFTG